MKKGTVYLALFLLAVVLLISDLIYSGLKKKHPVKRIYVLLGVLIAAAVFILADTVYHAATEPDGGYRYDEAYENLFGEEREKVEDLYDVVVRAIESPSKETFDEVAAAADRAQETCAESVSFAGKIPRIETFSAEQPYYKTFFPYIRETAQKGDTRGLERVKDVLENILAFYHTYSNPEGIMDKISEIQQFYTKLSGYRDAILSLEE